jgi:hypothetical protein
LIGSQHHALNLLLDLFEDSFRDTMLDSEEIRRQFVVKTYPLLVGNQKMDNGSDTNLAVSRYIQFLADNRFPGGKELLMNFIADYPHSDYIDEVKYVLR